MKLPANLAPLQFRAYRYFIVSRFFLIMALRMISTVVGYKLFQLTKSSFAIGVVGLSEFIPVFSLALYAGHVIDRSDKRTLLLKGVIAYSTCIVSLILLTTSWAEDRLPGNQLAYGYYATIFITGIIRAYVGPTYNAIVAQLVPREQLGPAVSINSSVWLAASITGHASAGFFIAWFGVHHTFSIVLVYVFIAALMVSFIPRLPVSANLSTRALDSVKKDCSMCSAIKFYWEPSPSIFLPYCSVALRP